jgi:hypothetical protein
MLLFPEENSDVSPYRETKSWPWDIHRSQSGELPVLLSQVDISQYIILGLCFGQLSSLSCFVFVGEFKFWPITIGRND